MFKFLCNLYDTVKFNIHGKYDTIDRYGALHKIRRKLNGVYVYKIEYDGMLFPCSEEFDNLFEALISMLNNIDKE